MLLSAEGKIVNGVAAVIVAAVIVAGADGRINSRRYKIDVVVVVVDVDVAGAKSNCNKIVALVVGRINCLKIVPFVVVNVKRF